MKGILMKTIMTARDTEIDMTIEKNATPLAEISYLARKHPMPPLWKRIFPSI